VFSLAAPVAAQEDVLVIPDGGIYTFKSTWDTDYAEVCFFNEASSEELGCVTEPEPEVHPVTGNPYCKVQVTVMNPGADVNVRAFARDASGNQSEDSPNKAVVDFTPPSAPTILE